MTVQCLWWWTKYCSHFRLMNYMHAWITLHAWIQFPSLRYAIIYSAPAVVCGPFILQCLQHYPFGWFLPQYILTLIYDSWFMWLKIWFQRSFIQLAWLTCLFSFPEYVRRFFPFEGKRRESEIIGSFSGCVL